MRALLPGCYPPAVQGTTETRTVATLDALMAEASNFAPCILLLRHLPVLTSGPPGAPPPPTSGILQVADALALGIERYGSVAARAAVLGARNKASTEGANGELKGGTGS